ncbi:MAG: amidase [Caulobacteraceae bacterium]
MSSGSRRDVSRRLVVAGAAAGLASTKAWAAAAPPDPEPYLSLRAVARRIAAREVSPVDLTRRMLARIAKIDPMLKSYATVMGDQAIADAQMAASEIAAGRYRGPLHGVPIGIKDLCWTKGVRTMGGLAVRRSFVPSQDATVVARLRAAGAVILGKTNLSEGAAAGYNPAMDVPLNPWNHDRWPGMSSSGSGVALAAGLCFAAVGTDTGGSIRMPSSANGVVGLKPTYGRVSRFGVMPMAPSLDHVGPMAREVADVAIMFDAMAGHDPADPTSLDAPPAQAVKALGGGVRGLRIGVAHAYALEHIDPGQARAIEAALKVLERQGAVIKPVRMPDLADVAPSWMTICSMEMAAAHAATYPSRAAEYGPYLREFLAGGGSVTPKALAEARRHRAELTTRLNAMLDTVDVMAGPAGGDPAWPITHALQTGPLPAYHQAWSAAQPRSAEFTMPMDLAGVPALCLPCGISADGLPYSIQFTGRRLSEPMLCRVAYAYEQATDWRNRHPPSLA